MLQTDNWLNNFDKLTSYVDAYGDGLVPSGYKCADGTRLGNWVNYQRSRYRSGKLSPQRASLLESVCGWQWGPMKPGPRPKTSNLDRDSRIVEMGRAGLSLREIANQLGNSISRQRVHQILAEKAPRRAGTLND